MVKKYLKFVQNGSIVSVQSMFDKEIGELIPNYHGYDFVINPNSATCSWSAHILREVANKLDELNVPCRKAIDQLVKS